MLSSRKLQLFEVGFTSRFKLLGILNLHSFGTDHPHFRSEDCGHRVMSKGSAGTTRTLGWEPVEETRT